MEVYGPEKVLLKNNLGLLSFFSVEYLYVELWRWQWPTVNLVLWSRFLVPVVCKKHSAACTVCWRRNIMWGILEALLDGISPNIVNIIV